MRRFILPVILALGIVAVANAAVTPNSYVTPQTPNNGKVQFLQGTDSAGTDKTLYTGGLRLALLRNMDDDKLRDRYASRDRRVVNSAVKYGGTAITTVLGAGFTTGVPPQNIMTAANGRDCRWINTATLTSNSSAVILSRLRLRLASRLLPSLTKSVVQ